MRIPRKRRGPATGFTLVELMVALLLSLLLATAMVFMQVKFANQTVRGSDTGLRDNEARAAIDLITQDLNGSGFVMSGSELSCNGLFTFNNTIAGNYVTHHAVDAVAATVGTTPKYAPTVLLTYPPAATPSDVLAITVSSGATNFTNSNIVALQPTNGAAPAANGVLPLSNATTFAATEQGILQVAYAGRTACFRIPMDAVGPTAVGSVAGGQYMPGTYYAGYLAELNGAGFAGAPGNAPIMQGVLVDMRSGAAAPAATPALKKYVYYIDQQAGSFPQLMRAQYDLATDALVPNTAPQPVAAGVVSLQVLFGVDPNATGGVTACLTAANVVNWDTVRNIYVAIVTRSLNDDPDANYVPITRVVLPGNFTSLNILAAYGKRHYLVSQVAVAARNTLTLTNAGAAAGAINAAPAATGCP